MSATPCGCGGAVGLLTAPERRALALRLTLSLAAAVCLALSFGLTALTNQHDVAEGVAGLAAALVGGPAVAAAWRSLRSPDLHGVADLLIGLAFLAAWASGDVTTAAVLPLIMTVGHILEERSLLGSQEAIRALITLTATTARRRRDDGTIEVVAADALWVGDRIDIRAGDHIPADGTVESGHSSIDTASISGESVPVEVEPGASVFGGSINLTGQLIVKVTHIGTETALGRVIALMQAAEATKPAVSRLLERYAGRYLVFVLVLAAAVWILSDNTAATLAVLVAACPCALVLAAPATSIAAIAVASRHGILVKSAAFLEQLAHVDAVVFDKTGTLTVGQLRLVAVAAQPGIDPAALLMLAASLAAASSHPVSRALTRQIPAAERQTIADLHETRGLGLCGQIEGQPVALGRALLFQELGVSAPPPPPHPGPMVGVSCGGAFWGWLLLADTLRPEAQAAVAELHALGLSRQVLLTGDLAPEAHRVAAQIGRIDVHAEALPAQKMQLVLDEIAAGYHPMVVGDGINDALALKVGAVGVAMGAQGTDIALASADLVLMTNDLRRLGTCVRLSRRCRQTVLTNVALGLGWTIVVVGLAAAGDLGSSAPLVAAVLHNLGTLAVMANAGRLLKFHDELPTTTEHTP